MTPWLVLLGALALVWLGGELRALRARVRRRRAARRVPPPDPDPQPPGWTTGSVQKPLPVTPEQLTDGELERAMADERRRYTDAADTYQWLLAEQATRIAARWGVADAERHAQGGRHG